ncbi:MAG: cell division protein FtsQ [Acidobacteria bacterium]|nr:cell division protein FtsQ [Acidobacteriota bacterium]
MSGPAAPPGPTGPRRHPARRRWTWILGIVAVLLVGATAVVLHSPWMSVRQIEILGSDHADVAGRLVAAGVGEGAIMIWLNPGEIEAAVGADPWVREVRVERIFPSRLVVEVLEHTAAVWVSGEGSWMLVARTGAVLATADAPGEGLLLAEVFYPDHEAGEEPGGEWQELAELGWALGEDLAAGAVVTRERGELWLQAGGCRARLGPATQLAEKGRAFAGLLEAGLPTGAEVDLIAPSRPAVTVPGGAPPDGEGTPSG